ncbi:universal stress protein [Pengzhenrongella sicca]|uniref:Universal stress protein n=1 Tax=Pengzhenrongella sicca TaxID=2819238 RepID=A0A8A4Z7S3_9MICO|nr:universal stress protein [Pengzhenrongella sicca]QTE27960.1 universal stress protein [Pengzhenrongella sicca]
MARTVVVGVEGTPSSAQALVWAATIAAARKVELSIVCATGDPYASVDIEYDDAIEQAATSLLKVSTERALAVAPELVINAVLAHGGAAKALTDASSQAALVVVGSRPLGLMERAFAGSLSYQIAAGSHCPVLVVPEGAAEVGTGVVVGSDGSAESMGAVALAAAEADRFGQELTVLHAWHTPLAFMSVDIVTESDDAWVEESRRVILAEAVAGLGERYPDLVIHQKLVHDQPARALLDAARGARMVVVGSRGRHGIARMLLGSVSHTVVLHAPCPVLVARS